MKVGKDDEKKRKNQLGSNIIIVYFKHITHIVVISTHNKSMGYVIIHKPNCLSHEGINSRCRRLDFFRHFDLSLL